VATLTFASNSNAFAQAKQAPKQAPAPAAKQQAAPPPQPPPMKQMALTEKQIEGVLAASKRSMRSPTRIPENAKPDPKVTRSSTRSQRRTALPVTPNTTTWTDKHQQVMGGSIRRPEYVGPEAVLEGAELQPCRPTRKCRQGQEGGAGQMNEALKSPAPAIENKGAISTSSPSNTTSSRLPAGRSIGETKKPGEFPGALFSTRSRHSGASPTSPRKARPDGD